MNGRTILPGTFDGVHLGHRFLINTAKEIKDDTRLTVLTFNPHPRFFLGQFKEDFLLTTQEEKEALLHSAGVDEVITLPFDDALRDMSPKEFFEGILLGKLGVKKIVVGNDFRFGKNREGNVDVLCRLSSLHNVEVFPCPPLEIRGKVVRSERIRKLLKEGKVEEAAALLGRFYYLKGKVVRGEGLGHQIGFPTANLETSPEKLLPGKGVYAVKVKLGEKYFAGICYLGNKPTLSLGSGTVCEVHVLDTSKDFLGETMEVLFVEKVREEKKFPSLKELAQQIEKDIAGARRILPENDTRVANFYFEDKI